MLPTCMLYWQVIIAFKQMNVKNEYFKVTDGLFVNAFILSFFKVSKPLMEKKRRARINKCLDQLKSLLENYYTSNVSNTSNLLGQLIQTNRALVLSG